MINFTKIYTKSDISNCKLYDELYDKAYDLNSNIQIMKFMAESIMNIFNEYNYLFDDIELNSCIPCDIDLEYIYGKIQVNKYIGNGSNQENVSLTDILNIQIPIPKSPQKIKEWVDKISIPYNEKNTKQTKIKDLEIFVQNRIREISENKDYNEIELGNLCEYIKTGKNKTPDNKEGTLYPYYGTADITGYTNHYLFDGIHILVARNGTMGNCFLVEGKIYPSDHIFVIKNNKNISILMLYYLIKSISTEIKNSSNGSIIKGISKENLSKIKIKISKNQELIKELEAKFKEIETLKNDVRILEELYKKIIKELTIEAIPKNSSYIII